MPLNESRVIVACAGSGKTTRLVLEAIAHPDRRIAFTTFTISNTKGIVTRFGEYYGGVPKHVDVTTWFSFLLRECARPYQHAIYAHKRIASIKLVKGQSTQGIAENRTKNYYFADGELIYTDKLSLFALRCEEASKGCVTRRLRQVYTDIFIDECQDLSGWDLDFVELLLRSDLRVTLVGDPRQSILKTNCSSKNKHFRRAGVIKKIKDWQKVNLCQINTVNQTRRCNRSICGFANLLWPDMEQMSPMEDVKTEHDGVFLVPEKRVQDYIERFRPQVLKNKYREKAPDYERTGLNFGVAKGMEYDHVLIVPTGPIRQFLNTGDPAPLVEKEKLHVAVTRARHSVAFVYDGDSPIVSERWDPGSERKERQASFWDLNIADRSGAKPAAHIS